MQQVHNGQEDGKPASRTGFRGGPPTSGVMPLLTSQVACMGEGVRTLQEETQHLACGVRPPRVGVGAGRAAARPGVPGSVHGPLLNHRPPGLVHAQLAAVSVSAGNAPVLGLLGERRGRCQLRDDRVGVEGGDRLGKEQVGRVHALMT